MKYLKEKNNKKIKVFKKKELDYLFFKTLIFCSDIDNQIKDSFFNIKWFRLGKKISFVKIGTRCIFTNSSFSVLRRFRLHRMALRLNGSYGYINGLKKSSW